MNTAIFRNVTMRLPGSKVPFRFATLALVHIVLDTIQLKSETSLWLSECNNTRWVELERLFALDSTPRDRVAQMAVA